MTKLDDKLVPKVKVLLDKYGKSVTHTRVTESIAYATNTTTTTETTQTVNVTPPESVSDRYVDGTLVQRGDARVSMAASGLTFTPANGDTVTIDSEVWTVVSIEPTYSGESIALYVMLIRK